MNRSTTIFTSTVCARSFLLAGMLTAASLLFMCIAIAGATTAHASEPEAIQEDPDELDDGIVDDEPIEEDLRQANEHFEQGAEHYFSGNYGRAIVEFRRASRLYPHPMILYNKSLAYLHLGDIEDAHRTAVEAGELEGLPADEATRNAARADATGVAITATAVGDDVEQRIADRRRTVDEEPPDVEPPPEVDDPSGLGAVGWIGVVTTMGGVGLLGYAGVLEFQLDDRIQAYETAAEQGDQTTYNELRSEIEQTTQRGRIALYSGAGLAAAGITMWLIGGLSGSSPDHSATSWNLQLLPAVGTDESGAGMLNLTGRF